VEIRNMKTGLAFVGLFLGLGTLGCGSSASGGSFPTLNAADFGTHFKFADNQVSGWTQSTFPGSFNTYTGDELVTAVDGGAGVYVDKGMRVCMSQDLMGTDPQIVTVWAYDFTTAAKAKDMFDWKKSDSSASATIPNYDGSVAIGAATSSGLSAIAHFNSLYFEVMLSGYGDQKTTCSACPVAPKFLDVFKTKSN